MHMRASRRFRPTPRSGGKRRACGMSATAWTPSTAPPRPTRSETSTDSWTPDQRRRNTAGSPATGWPSVRRGCVLRESGGQTTAPPRPTSDPPPTLVHRLARSSNIISSLPEGQDPDDAWTLTALFAGTVVAANWAVNRYGIVPVGFGLMAPAGVYFAGLAFGLRDAVHETGGRRWVTRRHRRRGRRLLCDRGRRHDPRRTRPHRRRIRRRVPCLRAGRPRRLHTAPRTPLARRRRRLQPRRRRRRLRPVPVARVRFASAIWPATSSARR